MKNAVLAQIEESRSLLNDYRNLLARFRYTSSPSLYDLLHAGAEMAGNLMSLVKEAHSKGIIDAGALMAAVQVSNQWLAFDEEVEEVLDAALPLQSPPRSTFH